MGKRFFNERGEWYVSFSEKWSGKPGNGRYMKRSLSKARRRYAKCKLRGISAKEPTGLESLVNYKGW